MLKTSTTILFQGDSITNAFRMPDEMNNAYQLGAGYAMLISARLLATRPDDHLIFHNRGISGQGIRDLQGRWQPDCLALTPDLLSILVGVNDADPFNEVAALPLDQYARIYRDLLHDTRQALPAVRLVLCSPFLLNVNNPTKRGVADIAAQAEFVKALADEFDAVYVPLYDVFTRACERAPAEYWSYDGYHPNAQGHWLIAETWLESVNV
jgi:lysophospholipase L1-like esterase